MNIAFDLLHELDVIGIRLEIGNNDRIRARAVRGVITTAHHTQIFEHKTALLAAMDLQVRIHRMAKRWQYTGADLAEVISLARLDPDGWQRTVALDEKRFGRGEHL